MKISKCDLVMTAGRKDQFPASDLPEFAFAGRSNVGKSSLLNMLMNRRSFARVSATPGKTRTINFYELNGGARFVDLPGYGYAKVGKNLQSFWSGLIEPYLMDRENLLDVVLLVDIRHEPTAQDIQMYEWIRHYGYQGMVVATKLDKIPKAQVQKQLAMIRKTLGAPVDGFIMAVSNEDRRGKYQLWDQFNKRFEEAGLAVRFERQQPE